MPFSGSRNNRKWKSGRIIITPNKYKESNHEQSIHYSTLAAMIVLLFLTARSVASNDTLVVYATPITVTLDSVIAQDQRAATPHGVYKLVSTDTPYVFNKSVVVNNSVSFVGVLGAQGRPQMHPAERSWR